VLEQGPYLTEEDFVHDEIKVINEDLLTNKPKLQPTSFRKTPNEKAKPQRALVYGRLVGGTSVHFTANFWRFHEIDFVERSKIGPVAGADLRDWPITYADLEPYYTKVEWEIGVSGLAGASPFDPPRSKPYPMPPLPVKGSGVIFERAARKLGWHPFPAPMAILSQPRAGRSACVNCGFCLAFGCEVGAKSSSLAAAIPVAEKTGRCEIRPNSYVHRIEMDSNGRISQRPVFFGYGNGGGKRTGLCADFAAEGQAEAAVDAGAASSARLRKNGHGRGERMPAQLASGALKITPEPFTGSGGMGYGLERGGSNGLAPARPETPISHSTLV